VSFRFRFFFSGRRDFSLTPSAPLFASFVYQSRSEAVQSRGSRRHPSSVLLPSPTGSKTTQKSQSRSSISNQAQRSLIQAREQSHRAHPNTSTSNRREEGHPVTSDGARGTPSPLDRQARGSRISSSEVARRAAETYHPPGTLRGARPVEGIPGRPPWR